MNENEIGKAVIQAAGEMHREVGGPGLLEDSDFNAKTPRRRDAVYIWTRLESRGKRPV